MRKNLCYILKVIFILLVSLNISSLYSQKVDLVRYVNTLQGTNSRFELTRGILIPQQPCLLPCILGHPKRV